MNESPPASVSSLRDRVFRGAAWMLALRACDRLIGLASMVVLARLLVPADFGVVALAQSLIALIALLGAFGLETALIQNPSAERRHYDTVWTFNVLFGAFMAAALALSARPTADFYNDTRLVTVVLVLAAARAVSGFSNVGTVGFQKELEFDREFRLRMTTRVATTFAVTLPLAFWLRDYRALLAGSFTATVLAVVLSYRMHPYRPRFSLAAWRELFSFSKWMFATNVIGFVFGRATDFILGRLAGTAALGAYTLANEIARVTSSEFSAPIQRAVFPGYAKVSGDAAKLREGYLKVLGVLALVIAPMAVGLALVAQPAVALLLGSRWAETADVVRILAIDSALIAGMSTTYYVFIATGKPQRLAGVLGAHAAISILLMLWLIPLQGAVGAAWASLAATLATLPVAVVLLARTLAVARGDLAAAVWRPVAGSLVMAGPVLAALEFMPAAGSVYGEMVRLAVTVIAGAIAYGAAVTALWRAAGRPDGAERFALERARPLLTRIRGAGRSASTR